MFLSEQIHPFSYSQDKTNKMAAMSWSAAFFLLLVLSLVYAQDGALDVNRRDAIDDISRDVSKRSAKVGGNAVKMGHGKEKIETKEGYPSKGGTSVLEEDFD